MSNLFSGDEIITITRQVNEAFKKANERIRQLEEALKMLKDKVETLEQQANHK